MQATEFGGFTGALPRLFSIPVLAVGIFLLTNAMGMPIVPGRFPGFEESLFGGGFLTVFGLHGLVTNTSRVGIVRRFLSYASGVGGGVICWRIAEQLGWL